MSDLNALRGLPRSGWTATVACVLALCGVPVLAFSGVLSIYASMDTRRPIFTAAAVIFGLSAAMLLLGAMFLYGGSYAGRVLILIGCSLVASGEGASIILTVLQHDVFNGVDRIRMITVLLSFLAFPFTTSIFALTRGTSQWMADQNHARLG